MKKNAQKILCIAAARRASLFAFHRSPTIDAKMDYHSYQDTIIKCQSLARTRTHTFFSSSLNKEESFSSKAEHFTDDGE